MKNRLKLFIPGPVDPFDDTLDALSRPMRSPFFGDAYWRDIYWETLDLLKQVFQTKNDIILMTGPGSGVIEAGLASLFTRGEKVALVLNGFFAQRLKVIMQTYGYQVIQIESELGTAIDVDSVRQALGEHPDIAGLAVVASETSTGVKNPTQALAELARQYNVPIFVDAVSAMGGFSLPVDEWGLDIVCTSSNKALEMSPGLGMISISKRAWELIDARKDDGNRGWYYNLSNWKPMVGNRERSFLTTPAVSLVMGLHATLKHIIETETLAGHWARIAWAQRVARAGLRNLGFEMLVRDADASPTVTTFIIRDDMESSQELQSYLVEKHDFLFSTAFGPLSERVLRFAHMGKASTKDYLLPCLMGVEEFVRVVKGVAVPVGASLVGLTETIGD